MLQGAFLSRFRPRSRDTAMHLKSVRAHLLWKDSQ